MKDKNFKDYLVDSFDYCLTNWISVLLLGLILCLINFIDKNPVRNNILSIILNIIILFLALYESGFSYRIFKDTHNNIITKPGIQNIKETFFHGILETFLFLFYGTITALLLVIFSIFILNDLNQNQMILILITILATSLIITLMMLTIINITKHEGNIKKIFKIRDIYNICKKIGMKYLIFIYIIISIVLFSISNTYVLSDDLNFYGFTFKDFIITPFLIIFTQRLIASLAK